MKVWRQGFEPPRNGEKLRFSSGLKAEHEKHTGKLQKLAHDRRFEAQRSNQLLSGEKLKSKEVQEMVGHQLKNDGAAKRKHERITKAVTDPQFD